MSARNPHDHKGNSEEKCVRCGWVMGHRPLNCMNDDTPHVFPSQQTEIERLRDWHSEMFQYAADRDAEIERLRALTDQLVHLLPHFHLSQRCQPPQGVALEDWCTECHAVAAYREARRER